MRIPSGKTDVSLYFVAVDPTDLKTRETGLSGFTVIRSRNGGADTAYTTPTVTEIDSTTMPGVYALLVDEDTTIGSGSDSEEYCVHVTHASMAPVTRTIELYRRAVTSGRTLGVEASGALSAIANGAIAAATFASNALDAVWSTATRLLTAGTNIVLAKGTGVTGFNDLSAAAVNAEVDTAIADVGLTTTITGRIDAAVSTRATQTSVDTVDGIVDAILVDTAEIGTAGAGLTNINLPNQTMDIVGNITGNLSGSVGSVTGNVGGNVTGSVGSVAAGGITASSIATNAIDGDALAADAVTEIQSGLATAASLATVAGYLDTEIAAILADTNELQTDWADGGRLDLILDARASQASVDTIDGIVDSILDDTGTSGVVVASIANNAVSAAAIASDAGTEIATAVWASGTRTLSALDEDSTTVDLDATIRAAVGLASANLDTQIDALPTNAELATALGTADDAVLAQVALVKAVTDKIDDTLEDDAGTYRFTANALEEAPSGGGGGPTASQIADEVQTRTIAAVTTVNGLAANTVTASALASDAVTEIQSGLATAAALATVDANVDAILEDTGTTLPATLATIAGYIDTEVAAIKAKTDLIPGTQDGKTFAEMMVLMSAVLLGKASGLDTNTAIYRAINDSKDRVTGTVDEFGNRSAVVLDPA